MNKYKVSPQSIKSIRILANTIRTKLGLDNDRALPVIPLLEFGSSIFGYDYEYIADSDLKNEYAKTVYEKGKVTILIRESVYLGAYKGIGRDRFTIVHELGHALMHFNTEASVTLCRIDEKPMIYEDPEWQANTFAGEMLVPVEHIKKEHMSCSDIAQKYKVSQATASIMLKKAYK